MQKIVVAFTAIIVAGFVTGGVARPAFFRMADGSAGSGGAVDVFGVTLWMVFALSFGLVFWILSRVFAEQGPAPAGAGSRPSDGAHPPSLGPRPSGLVVARILIGIGLVAWIYWAVDFEAPRRLGYEIRNGKVALVLWGGLMAWGLWRKLDQRHGRARLERPAKRDR